VVTGATSGLGAAMAEALLIAGAAVGIAARPTPRLSALVDDHRRRGLRAEALPVDVRDSASVKTALAAALDRLGDVDLVVNNAGIGMRSVNQRFLTQPQPFFDVPIEGFTDVVTTNLTGYFLVGRTFAPHMIERGGGRFVNISINHQTMARRGFVPYGPSRAASEALSAVMAADLAPFGVAVNVLVPGGATDTGMIPEGLPEDSRRQLLHPSIMGPPIVFLASAEAAGLTGQRLVARDFEKWLRTFRATR
jgi:NAD(P)-dependent dehydrogenase (short-subunit alcohol dehydrogenase family)